MPDDFAGTHPGKTCERVANEGRCVRRWCTQRMFWIICKQVVLCVCWDVHDTHCFESWVKEFRKREGRKLSGILVQRVRTIVQAVAFNTEIMNVIGSVQESFERKIRPWEGLYIHCLARKKKRVTGFRNSRGFEPTISCSKGVAPQSTLPVWRSVLRSMLLLMSFQP